MRLLSLYNTPDRRHWVNVGGMEGVCGAQGVNSRECLQRLERVKRLCLCPGFSCSTFLVVFEHSSHVLLGSLTELFYYTRIYLNCNYTCGIIDSLHQGQVERQKEFFQF